MGTCVSPCLLVYDAAKRPFLQEPIHAGFRVLPQAGNYASFHTSDGQGWSVLMRSTEDWEALAVELVVARYAAGVLAMVAGGAPPGIITLDISPPPPSAEDGTPPLRIGEWDTVQLTYTVRGDAEWRGAAAAVVPMYSAEAVKMELDPGTVPRGLAAGLAGSFKGGRRLVLVPAVAAAAGVMPPGAPTAPPLHFLLYDVTVSRVKKAKHIPPPTQTQPQAAAPAPPTAVTPLAPEAVLVAEALPAVVSLPFHGGSDPAGGAGFDVASEASTTSFVGEEAAAVVPGGEPASDPNSVGEVEAESENFAFPALVLDESPDAGAARARAYAQAWHEVKTKIDVRHLLFCHFRV